MDKSTEQYFDEANRWDADRSSLIRQSARRAWYVASVACTLAVVSGGAVALLTPLKRVEPFLIRVDASTGIVDVVPEYTGTSELPDSVLRHLVTEYVTQRERYIPALAETDYEQVGAYHSAAMNQAWSGAWARSNPESPLNLYTDEARITAQVRSISFLKRDRQGPDVVQVRLSRSTQRSVGSDAQVEQYVVTMTTAFGPPSGDLRLRTLNPLGFKVLEYRREPEIAEPPATTAGAVGAGGAQ